MEDEANSAAESPASTGNVHVIGGAAAAAVEAAEADAAAVYASLHSDDAAAAEAALASLADQPATESSTSPNIAAASAQSRHDTLSGSDASLAGLIELSPSPLSDDAGVEAEATDGPSPSASASPDDDERNAVFEISDFTTASHWERFTSSLEQLFRKWGVDQQQCPTLATLPTALAGLPGSSERYCSQVLNLSETLVRVTLFFDARLQDTTATAHIRGMTTSVAANLRNNLVHTHATAQMMQTSGDFVFDTHDLGNWFGLNQYIAVTSANGGSISPSDAKLIFSSLNLAAVQSRCVIPLFVQVYEPWRKMYLGSSCDAEAHTKFDTLTLQSGPVHYRHLTGLVDLFNSKLALPPALAATVLTTVAVRFTYVLSWWFSTGSVGGVSPSSSTDTSALGPATYSQDAAAAAAAAAVEPVPATTGDRTWLEWGCTVDPVSSLQVAAGWPACPADHLVDNSVHSDLNWSVAPELRARIVSLAHQKLTVNTFDLLLLTSNVRQFTLGCHSRESLQQLLSRFAAQSAPPPSFPGSAPNSDLVKQRAAMSMRITAILEDLLAPSDRTATTLLPVPARLTKAAPRNSLCYALSLYFCFLNKSVGLPSVAALWREFLHAIRRHWEKLQVLPRVFTEPTADSHTTSHAEPDMSACLLYQKLQMLNLCITSKLRMDRLRHQASASSSVTPLPVGSSSKSHANGEDDDGDDEDEFFLAPETEDDRAAASSAQQQQRLGVLRETPLLMMDTHQPICVPLTQEPAPMTEDMVYEQQQILIKLGESEEGARIRVRMQASSLLSDMEAFKAANPGCRLEDFVRWHSPRDWILPDAPTSNPSPVEEDVNGSLGHLSQRFQQPGNTWVEVWEGARSVPVAKQRSLFDFTKEAEKVLHFLENLPPATLLTQLLPCVLDAALATFDESSPVSKWPSCAPVIRDLEFASSILSKDLAAAFAAAMSGQTANSAPTGLISAAVESLTNLTPTTSLYGSNLSGGSGGMLHMLAFSAHPTLDTKLHQVLGAMARVELTVATAMSLQQKLSAAPDLANALTSGHELVLNDAHRALVMQLLASKNLGWDVPAAAANKSTAKPAHHSEASSTPGEPRGLRPTTREFILRAFAPRPGTPGARFAAHRMYCLQGEGEFRIAGAFTTDTVYH
ncbi:hypothetical protein CAOG_04608 [Capsaspora owczarzaki ATCC 30864]|uniref:hypothetical protein n=1 Tax=Capsaspora owczarzaki (strain ATCC 30864) TaxID=595528 RepID=UPI00035248B1|nr:hypothetical protein CAOG_04608 [Capsaspora owczarzaki ATCC 30864]|eukprot:XP_004347355.2 hypothetical protein CAOG_04608 [Capsaspora owczarzaki ATCC 30864]